MAPYRSGPKSRRMKKKSKTLKKKVARLAAVVSKTVKGEQRYYDYVLPDAGIDTSGYIHSLTLMGTGDINGSRDGTTVVPGWIEARLFLEGQEAAELNKVRIIFFQDKGSGALGTPLVADVLQPADTYSTTIAPVFAPYNRENRKRFKILYDRVFSVANEQLTSGSGYSLWHEPSPIIRISCKNCKPVTYIGSGSSTPGSVGTGHIYLMAISDSGTTPDPDLQGTVRFVYTP